MDTISLTGRSSGGELDTVPVTTIQELIIPNELKRGGLKTRVFKAIEKAEQEGTFPDISFCK